METTKQLREMARKMGEMSAEIVYAGELLKKVEPLLDHYQRFMWHEYEKIDWNERLTEIKEVLEAVKRYNQYT